MRCCETSCFARYVCLARIAVSSRYSCCFCPVSIPGLDCDLFYPFHSSAIFFLWCPSRTAHCLLLTQVLMQSRLTCPEGNTHFVRTRVPSGQTGQSSIPDLGQHKAMRFIYSGLFPCDLSSLRENRGEGHSCRCHRRQRAGEGVLRNNCETSCFARFVCLAKRSASCLSFCVSFVRPSIGAAFRLSGFPAFRLSCPSHLSDPSAPFFLPSADRALPSGNADMTPDLRRPRRI